MLTGCLIAALIIKHVMCDSGPPRPIFGRQGRYIRGVPPLPPRFSILQNPGKAQVLEALLAVAALLCSVERWFLRSIIVIFNFHFQDNFDTLCVHLFRTDDDLDSIHNLLRKGHFCSCPPKGPRWFRPRLHMGSFIKSQKVSFFQHSSLTKFRVTI